MLHIYTYEINIFDIRAIAYNLPSPIQDGILCYSFWIFSSFGEYPNKMLLPFFITVIEFISCHPLRLHAVSKLSAESH